MEPPQKPTAAAQGRAARRYAIACLVMRGDGYVPGALVAAFSARCAGTSADLVCMDAHAARKDIQVTDDVTAAARASLLLVFDRVVEVPYIRAAALPLATAKQQDRYGAWMSTACTKWNVLALDEYDKVLFLDADKLVLSSLDELFALRAPAATFSSPWSSTYVANSKRGHSLENPYEGLRHGDRVRPDAIRRGLDHAFVAIGTTMLLRPSRSALARLCAIVGAGSDDPDGAPASADDAQAPADRGGPNSTAGRLALPPAGDLRDTLGKRSSDLLASPDAPVKRSRPTPFGHPRCHSGTDEQAICCLYLDLREDWTWIHQRHNYIPWQPQWIADTDDPPTVFHYFNTKPWQMARTEWPDLEVWWLMVTALVRKHPTVAVHYDPASLQSSTPPGPPTCSWCTRSGRELARLRAARRHQEVEAEPPPHATFDDAGGLTCPALQGPRRRASLAPPP